MKLCYLSVGERPLSDHELHVTISGGLTVWEWEEQLDRAIDRADQLLYAAEAAGRNRIETDVAADT